MEQGAFGNIVALLRAQSGVDFTHYKEAILKRRIKRRMTALHLESPEEYESYLRAHPSEMQSLLNDILVVVAGFFRIPAAFKWFKKSHESESGNESDPPGTTDTEKIEKKDFESAKRRFRSVNRARMGVTNLPETTSAELENAAGYPGLFKALVDSCDDAIIMKDINGIIRTWNKGAERIFGYRGEEIIGKPVTVLMPPALRKEEAEILARVRAGERIDHYETIRVCKDGRLVHISLTVSPIVNAEGRIVGASKIARDVTEQKRWEAEIKRAHDEAEQANHAKDEFLATLSHELRTPLNPVLLLASESAADPDLPPVVRANFDVIRRNIELEARLIDDLLDLTRVRTGKLKIEKNDVNVHAVLSDTISIIQKEIERKHLTLKQNLADADSIVFGDAVRLRQIFWNVIKNAIKFTPRRGTVTVESRAEHGRYIVTVSDTGIGMTSDELATAFEAFKQGTHSHSGRFGGLGLGLAISKRFIELHSGSIVATSPGPDRGSTVTIQFPLSGRNRIGAALNLPQLQTASANGSGFPCNGVKMQHPASILLVEDHEPTRSTLAQILERRHHKVVIACSIREAMAIAEKGQFDLVISDIGLPDGNGYDLFKKIRDKSPMVKGIALSGYGMEHDLARSRNSGFQTHLTKPVKIEALEEALEETLAVEPN